MWIKLLQKKYKKTTFEKWLKWLMSTVFFDFFTDCTDTDTCLKICGKSG